MRITDASAKISHDSSLSPRLLLTAIVAVLGGGFHFGYQISLVNPMASVLQKCITDSLKRNYGISPSESITAFMWSFVVSILLVGAVLGSILVTGIIEKRGPLKGLIVSAVVQLISVLISTTSGIVESAELFILGRFFSGIGLGMGASAQGVFLAEISPNAHKGKIGTLGGLSTNIGFVTAAALGLPFVFGRSDLWCLVFAIESIPCLIFIASGLTWFHESPVFLLKSGRQTAANLALSAYGNQELYYQNGKDGKDDLSLAQIWREQDSRKALLLSVVLNVAVSFSGITAVSFFGTHMFSFLGFNSISAASLNCLCSLAGTAGALLATITTDKLGNRVLVLSGLVLLAILNTLMMLLVYLYSATKLAVFGWLFFTLFVLFLFVFSAGIGPAAWSLGAELAPDHSRAKVQSTAVCTQYLACFVSPILYYPLTEAVGPLSFLVFIVPLLLVAVYLFQNLPESREKSESNEIIEKF